MSMIFRFRMLSDEDDNFLRDYEISFDSTLKDFHNFICNDLDYDEYEMASFFVSDSDWQKLNEYTLVDMGVEPNPDDKFTPQLMESARIDEVAYSESDRLLYVFDIFEDRAYFVELKEVKFEDEEQEREYPRVVLSHGDAPDQFDASIATNNRSIFDEAMDDWGDYEGDDSYEEE